MMLQVAQRVAATHAEGPGNRYALWFQGCPLRCPGCCNPEMLSFSGGESVSIQQLQAEILQARANFAIEGITLLGGEPFAHLPGAILIAEFAQAQNMSVMIFSGYTLQELRMMPDPDVTALLNSTDLLVDGRYEQNLPEKGRRWIGSSNQRIHFLSHRYRADDPCWQEQNTVEIRWNGTELQLNGFPTHDVQQLWKKIVNQSADN